MSLIKNPSYTFLVFRVPLSPYSQSYRNHRFLSILHRHEIISR